jgi:hypothetical protein
MFSIRERVWNTQLVESALFAGDCEVLTHAYALMGFITCNAATPVYSRCHNTAFWCCFDTCASPTCGQIIDVGLE